LFSTILCDHVPEGCFTDWATENRGAFVLVRYVCSHRNLLFFQQRSVGYYLTKFGC